MEVAEAVFIDFYGTVVHEDGEIIREISQIIFETGCVEEKSQIGAFWWKEFQALYTDAYGDRFQTQRALEYISLQRTLEHFHSSADAAELSSRMFAHWRKPPAFEESKRFFAVCPVPIYIVSNIDRADILEAVRFHGLTSAGIFTSEDAKAYKPRKELFELALKRSGKKADEVVHIGDSLSSDVKGAGAVGIRAIWLNRSRREVPEGVVAVGNLMEVFQTGWFGQGGET